MASLTMNNNALVKENSSHEQLVVSLHLCTVRFCYLLQGLFILCVSRGGKMRFHAVQCVQAKWKNELPLSDQIALKMSG